MDMFHEKLIRRNRDIRDYLMDALIAVAAVILCFLFFRFIPVHGLLLSAVTVYGTYRLISARKAEYEYTITNEYLDIDMIMNKKSRKNVFSGDCKEFDLMARVDSQHYTEDIKRSSEIKDYTTGSKQAEVWFISAKHEGKQKIILFEPSREMIDTFSIFNADKVLK